MTEVTRHFISSVFPVKDGKVLLVKHSKLKMWLPPGGHIDRDELPDEAAVRELKEETGLDIDLLSNIKNFHRARILNQPQHIEVHPINDFHEHIAFVYFAKVVGGELIKNQESDEIKWFSKEDLDNHEINIEIIETAKKALDSFK